MQPRLLLICALSAGTGLFGCGNSGTTPTSSSMSAGAAGTSMGSAGQGSGGAAAGAAGSLGGAAGVGGSSAGSAGKAGEGAAGAATGNTEPLVIYWIDVEGGAATVLLAPNGELVVVDAGNPGERDAGRVATVLKNELQADHIDHLICTHYHGDHVGGIPELAAQLPVTHFYDHGATVQPSGDFNAYVALAGDKRILTKPGDVLELGDVVLTFVTAAGQVIEPALPGASANALCPSNVVKDMDGGAENGQSLGFVARFGSFDFVDLGDLTWDIEQKLMCPTNRIGSGTDLWQVNHHGQDFSNSPQLVHALGPTVAVMNNGPTKGGHVEVFDTLAASPGLEDVWALHEAINNDAQHNAAPDLIANPAGPDAAHYIKAVVEPNGSYTLTNARNAVSRSYASR